MVTRPSWLVACGAPEFTAPSMCVISCSIPSGQNEVPGVWFSGGWCGHGLPLSVQGGFEIARRITGGRAEPDVAWYRERARGLPGGRPRDWGLLAYLATLDRRDRALDRFGRVGHEFGRPVAAAERQRAAR